MFPALFVIIIGLVMISMGLIGYNFPWMIIQKVGIGKKLTDKKLKEIHECSDELLGMGVIGTSFFTVVSLFGWLIIDVIPKYISTAF
jgi:hypothetical protein